MTITNILSALLATLLGALATVWYGARASLQGFHRFPQAAFAWGHFIHRCIIEILLLWTWFDLEMHEFHFRQTYVPSTRSVFLGVHPSTVMVPSYMHALGLMTGDRHVGVIGKREYLQWFFRVQIGPWKIPLVPNIALPVFGLAALRAKVAIFIDRAGKEKTIQRIKEQIEAFPPQSNLLIFPEGTRFTPRKFRDPKHRQEKCVHTLRFNAGGLWAIMQVRPPSRENSYFWIDWACSKPDHNLLGLPWLCQARLFFRVKDVSDQLSKVRTKKELEIWLNSRREDADAFIARRRS